MPDAEAACSLGSGATAPFASTGLPGRRSTGCAKGLGYPASSFSRPVLREEKLFQQAPDGGPGAPGELPAPSDSGNSWRTREAADVCRNEVPEQARVHGRSGLRPGRRTWAGPRSGLRSVGAAAGSAQRLPQKPRGARVHPCCSRLRVHLPQTKELGDVRLRRWRWSAEQRPRARRSPTRCPASAAARG